MKIRLNAASILSVGMCWLTLGCGGAENASDTETVTLELATQIAALEVNQDGDDVDSADATDPEPLLMRSCGLAQVREKLVERFDVNDSRQLEEGERRELSEQFGGTVRPGRGLRRNVTRQMRLRRLMAIYDTDDSRDLSEAEREVLGADLQERCEARQLELLERFDADESGSLDDEEWRTAHEAIRDRYADNHQRIRNAFDDNDDGVLGPLERHNAREAKRDEMGERRDALRAQFDIDDSGDLDDTERAALRDAMRQRVRNPRVTRDEVASLTEVSE